MPILPKRPVTAHSAQARQSLARQAMVTQARMRAKENAASKKKILWKRIGAGVAAVLGAVGLGFGVKALAHRK